MSKRLDWNKLLCGERERISESKGNYKLDAKNEKYDHRNEFDKDYDRIVYSSSVRRLQDKAQVFPLQENDFTRTRLTHSIEVSALGRSLGYGIGKWLKTKEEISDEQVAEMAALLQVAAIIHDLGNPPFGHYGEEVIGNWFRIWFDSDEYKNIEKDYDLNEILTNQQKNDFINFEGNAQTLRIVSKLQILNDRYGVNFTYGTLATIIKYPWDSESNICKKNNGKFGYFSSEQNLVKTIQEKTGLENEKRHPLTLLLEAADDMAYLVADIEDAVKKGILPWDKEYNNIKNNLSSKYRSIFNKLDKKNDEIRENKIPNIELVEVQNFKVAIQGLMFKNVVETFKSNYEKIMLGEYKKELLKDSDIDDIIEQLEKLAKKYCFKNKEVITLELVGDNVIKGLLNKFVNPLTKCNVDVNSKHYAGKLYELISNNFKYVCCLDKNKIKETSLRDFSSVGLYERLLLITDFISGMTDSYAVILYKKLLGVKLS